MNQISVGGRILIRGQPARPGSYAMFVSLLGLRSGRGVRAGLEALPISRQPRPSCEIDSDGYFTVQVHLRDLYDAIQAENWLRYQIRAQLCIRQSPRPGLIDRIRGIDNGTITYGAVRSQHDRPLVKVVSLRSIANGNIPDPRDLGSFAGDAARAYSDLRQLARRLPTFGLSIGPPSTDFYAFFGFTIFNFP